MLAQGIQGGGGDWRLTSVQEHNTAQADANSQSERVLNGDTQVLGA